MGLDKVLGAVAPYGLGAIAVAGILWLFGGVISRNIFPKLDPERAYKILMRIVTLSFLLAVTAIIAWVVTTLPSPKDREQVASLPSKISFNKASDSKAPSDTEPVERNLPNKTSNAPPGNLADDVPWPHAATMIGRWEAHVDPERRLLNFPSTHGECYSVLHEDMSLQLSDRRSNSIEGTLSTELPETERYVPPQRQADYTKECHRLVTGSDGDGARNRKRTFDVHLSPAAADPARIMLSLTLRKCAINGDEEACGARDRLVPAPDRVELDANGFLHWDGAKFEKLS